MSVNPYTLTINIFRVIGWVLMWALILLVLVGIGSAAFSAWGWWAILWVPVILIAIIIVGAVISLISMFFGEVLPRWLRRRRYEWDRKNR